MPILAGNPVSGGDATGALLLITAYGQIWEIISALNSSPWTAENFGADAGKAKSAREYLAHSTISGSLASVRACKGVLERGRRTQEKSPLGASNVCSAGYGTER